MRRNSDKIIVAVIAAAVGGLIVFAVFRLTAGVPTFVGGLNPDITLLDPGCAPDDNDPTCRAFRGWYVNRTKTRINADGSYNVDLSSSIGDLFHIGYARPVSDVVAGLVSTDQNLKWDETETNLINQNTFIGSESLAEVNFLIPPNYFVDWTSSGNQSIVDIDIAGDSAIIVINGGLNDANYQSSAGQMMRVLVCTGAGPINTLTWTNQIRESPGTIRWINGTPLSTLAPNTCAPVMFLSSNSPTELELFGFYGESAYSI